MRLTIDSFGPIGTADFDLDRDFILIVGQNNIGKSYAISLMYAIIKSFSRFRRLPYYYYDDEFEGRPSSEIKKLVAATTESLASDGTYDKEITEEVTEAWKSLVSSTMVLALQQTLNGTFSDVANLQNRRSPRPLMVRLEDDKFLVELGVDGAQLVISKFEIKGRSFLVRKVKQNRSIKHGEQHTILYLPEGNPRHLESSVLSLLRGLSAELVESACGRVFDLHYLPASRSGLYQSLSAFGQIVAELSKSRTALRQKIELPGISEPLSDYYLKLSDVRVIPSEAATEAFHKAAAAIESEILHGTVEFESKTRRLLFKPTGVDLSLDLSATSSMVSEISPIASYLKYVLPRSQATFSRTRHYGPEEEFSQLLILEEPEAHLHPEIQVKLVEILATLARTSRTKIVVTSHSNYIFNKCSNLIISGAIDSTRFEAILFSSEAGGSITKELSVNRFGISDDNFGETGENLFEERRRLIEGLRDV
ncbi:MAG: AAA family ATPase [Betaproteobacteria bacterium]